MQVYLDFFGLFTNLYGKFFFIIGYSLQAYKISCRAEIPRVFKSGFRSEFSLQLRKRVIAYLRSLNITNFGRAKLRVITVRDGRFNYEVCCYGTDESKIVTSDNIWRY